MYYSEERNDTFTNKIIIKVITTNWHTELFHVNFEIRDYIKFIFYWLGKRRSQTLARDGYFRGTGQFFFFHICCCLVLFYLLPCFFVVKVTCHLLSMLKWIYVCKQKTQQNQHQQMEQEWFDQILQWHVKCHNPSAYISICIWEWRWFFLFLRILQNNNKNRKEESLRSYGTRIQRKTEEHNRMMSRESINAKELLPSPSQ